jgi:acyl dehydratase
MALNRSLIGKTYPPIISEVTAEALQKYARAYNDDNLSYFDPARPGGIIAPPMFNVVVTWLPLITVISDPELHVDLLRLLHLGQDMEFLALIRRGDRVSANATIVSIETVAAGEIITVQLDASNQQHAAVSRSRFTALIRSRRNRDLPGDGAAAHVPMTRGDSILTASQTIDRDQTVRYADASGDRNPIHLDEAVARMAGLPGIIVHGLCTMAFTSKLIVGHFCDGDPARLRRLAVKFSRPVFPGDTITTRIWQGPDRDRMTCLSYETCNPAGLIVIRDGVAEITPELAG